MDKGSGDAARRGVALAGDAVDVTGRAVAIARGAEAPAAGGGPEGVLSIARDGLSIARDGVEVLVSAGVIDGGAKAPAAGGAAAPSPAHTLARTARTASKRTSIGGSGQTSPRSMVAAEKLVFASNQLSRAQVTCEEDNCHEELKKLYCDGESEVGKTGKLLAQLDEIEAKIQFAIDELQYKHVDLLLAYKGYKVQLLKKLAKSFDDWRRIVCSAKMNKSDVPNAFRDFFIITSFIPVQTRILSCVAGAGGCEGIEVKPSESSTSIPGGEWFTDGKCTAVDYYVLTPQKGFQRLKLTTVK